MDWRLRAITDWLTPFPRLRLGMPLSGLSRQQAG